jgi:hypothetical protein
MQVLKLYMRDSSVKSSSGKLKKIKDENDLGMIRILCSQNNLGLIANSNEVI